MKQDTNRKRTVLWLSILVVVLALVLIYFVGVKPTYIKHENKIYVQGYTQGINYTIGSIFSSLQARGYVQIPLSQNQTLTLVPYTGQPSNNSTASQKTQ